MKHVCVIVKAENNVEVPASVKGLLTVWRLLRAAGLAGTHKGVFWVTEDGNLVTIKDDTELRSYFEEHWPCPRLHAMPRTDWREVPGLPKAKPQLHQLPLRAPAWERARLELVAAGVMIFMHLELFCRRCRISLGGLL